MRTKISLGAINTPAHARHTTRVELLHIVEEHMRKLNYTEKTRYSGLQVVKYLVDHYGVGGQPLTVEEGLRIRDDMINHGLRARAVTLKLFHYELIAEALGQRDAYGPGLWIPKPRREKPVNDYFTLEERDAMVRAAGNLRDRAVLWVGFSCGPRPDELCNIYLEDLDFSKKAIIIRDHGQHLKTGERKSIMNDSCVAAVRGWLEARPLVESHALFLNKYGDPLSMQRLREIVATTARDAGITRRAFPYMMRHSAATHILQNGGSVADAALQIGDSIETVYRHYVHKDYGSLERVVRRL